MNACLNDVTNSLSSSEWFTMGKTRHDDEKSHERKYISIFPLHICHDQDLRRYNHYIFARICFEQSLKVNPEDSKSLAYLASYHRKGLQTDNDYSTARNMYLKSLSIEFDTNKKSKKGLRRVRDCDTSFSANDWCSLGKSFHNGTDEWKQNYQCSRICFEHCIVLNPRHKQALYHIGFLYSRGQGVTRDVTKAREYLIRSISENYDLACIELLNMEEKDFSSGSSTATFVAHWNQLGLKYENEKWYVVGRICYEKALELDANYLPAMCNLAGYHYFIEHDLIKAGEMYCSILNRGDTADDYYNWVLPRTKRLLKDVERLLVEEILKDSKRNLDEPDSNGNTALHRMARPHQLKNIARIIQLGAKGITDEFAIQNNRMKTPFELLGEDRWNLVKKIRDLMTQVRKQRDQLSTPIENALASRVRVDGVPRNFIQQRDQFCTFFKKLLRLPAIKPLLELARLATFARHKLSNRNVMDDGYDSDDDSDPATDITDLQVLHFIINARSNNVSFSQVWNVSNCSGITLIPGDGVKHHNEIFVAGLVDSNESENARRVIRIILTVNQY